VPECEGVLSKIIDLTTTRVGRTEYCINIYDVRLKDTSPACGMNWPPTLSATYQYLARDDVRKALHVDATHKPEAWIECNHRVSAALRDHNGKASVTFLPSILEAGVQVMLFAGDQDLICNHIGVERIPQNLQWGGKGWDNPEKREWFVNNTLAGYWRTNRNLTYVSIAQASHMVGFDKPVESHDMMLRFMGVDLIAAAGPSARIPSRLVGEEDRLLVVGGGATSGTTKDDRPMIPGVDGKSEAQVAEEAKWAAY
jgi:carboxypeptidase D